MDIHQFGDWLAQTGPSQAIQASTWAIPAIQTVHIVALALVFTAGLLISLRFVGLGLVSESLQQLTERSARRIWWLLVVLLVTGALLITAEPGRTLTNKVFYAKMIMLVLVMALTAWLATAARRPFKPSGLHMVAATLAVLLWTAIIFAGRFIAYFESF